jgi:hypothetical protein
MKKLILTAVAVTCAASVFAQGTVIFGNRSAPVITRVYYNAAVTSQVVGNGTADTPPGTTDWTGWTAITGSGWMAAILGANGAAVPEGSLTFGANPTTTTFRGGANAGGFAVTTATINSVNKDAAVATLEVFVWDNKGGTLTDPTAALQQFRAGTLTGGLSGAFNVQLIGGDINTPPALTGLQSFNVFIVPEPATVALAGLGAAALLIFRRRK